MKNKRTKIEQILSPDLQLAQQRETVEVSRIEAMKQFAVGDRVRAGDNGKPGKLLAMSPNGMAKIQWPDGRILSGIAANELQSAPMPVLAIVATDGDDIVFRLVASDRLPSDVFRLIGRAQWIGGNPYSLYGDTAEQWLGLASYQETRITVATMSSGHLFDFV